MDRIKEAEEIYLEKCKIIRSHAIDDTRRAEQALNSCKELACELKQRLGRISDESGIDINTLWLMFESDIESIKADIKKEYNTTT